MKKAYITKSDDGATEHLCDLCLLMQEHKSKNVTPLARLALDLVQDYQDVFAQFTDNLKAINKINPADWMRVLRKNLLELFNNLNSNFAEYRNKKLDNIASLFD